MPGPSDPITTAFAGPIQIDQLRRWQGLWLDHLGFGPEPTPSRVVLERPGMRLHVYDGASGPPLLIVPAPIKRAYLWNLAPEASVVRRCVEAELAVHLIEWTDPQGEVTGYGLTDYADRMIGACREAVAAATGTVRVALAGHSLGGTLTALHAGDDPQCENTGKGDRKNHQSGGNRLFDNFVERGVTPGLNRIQCAGNNDETIQQPLH
jgi:hypothetical protein